MSIRAPTGPRPREIAQLVEDLHRAQGTPPAADGQGTPGEQGRAVFLIGAGCSASAGIHLASGVARDAVIHLAKTYHVSSSTDAIEALTALVDQDKFPEEFRPKDKTAKWGELYSYLFSEHMKHPNEQRELISNLVGDREYALNWAHACLGALVEKRFVHTILTTNFDQLALQGVIRTGIVPVVADGLESLTRISPTPKRPQVVHLHGSMHTYELRNSYAALRETESDRGLQVMMMSLLKEASVLIILGYAGGEEGVMTLLQYAAQALPRMVVYWIAFEDDFDLLSPRAKALLNTGENKFFMLGQRADDFFNKLVGELGIGAPDWIRRPLEVLEKQAEIAFDEPPSSDVARLVEAYKSRISTAAKQHGTGVESPVDRATELRSALKFEEAAAEIAKVDGYEADDELLSLHANSMFRQYKRRPDIVDRLVLNKAIDELKTLIERSKTPRIPDTITYIEALREQSESSKTDEADATSASIAALIEETASNAQATLQKGEHLKEWSLMEFYIAESIQAQAEQARREAEREKGTTPSDQAKERSDERKKRLSKARQAYVAALPGLSAKDAIKARECKEGLAGALIGMSEYEGEGSTAASHLREAQTLFREVVEFTRMNTPGEEYAGALENLADAMRSMRSKFPDEAHGSREEEVEVLRAALGVYEGIGSTDGAARMSRLLAD